MASILRVNTLTDASSNNSTPMATVASGTAKAWVRLNGTGTIAINKSFNTSSITDQGTGVYDQSFSSNFSDAVYNYVHGSKDSDDGMGIPTVGSDPRVADATSSMRLIHNYPPNTTFYDASAICNNIFGDLA